MAVLRFLFVFALFAVPFSVLAQNTEEAVKEKMRRETAFVEQILVDAKNLRLPENRAFVDAKVAGALWQTDENRARGLFRNAALDLLAAQSEAENEKMQQGVFGQFDLRSIAALGNFECDCES